MLLKFCSCWNCGLPCFIGGECDSSEFLSEQNLKDKAAHLIPNQIQVEDDVIIYQHLNITQDGRVVKWTFAAEDQGVGWKGPVMRIYRFEEGQENLFDFSSIQGSDAVATTYPNVYEITVDPPVAVYAGYFVGLELPPIDSVKLLLSFILNDSPPGVSIVNGDDVEGLPLIILEIGIMNCFAN